MSCHSTPWGGGPRNLFGKSYGSKGLGAAPTANSDLYYGDLRTVFYFPTRRVKERLSGSALMQASATANVPLSEGTEELRSVTTFNMAPLSGTQLREAYLRWRPGTEQPRSTYITLGQFYVPFGFLTDEHRAYTRLQTHMTLNDYNTGLGASFAPSSVLRTEFALVSDFRGSAGLNTGDFRFGTVANLRWNPQTLPFLLGASANYGRSVRERDPYAFSLYGGLSFDRLSGDRISGASGSAFIESVIAKNWNNPAFNAGGINPSLATFFIPGSSPALLSSLLTKTSVGFLAEVRWNALPRWTLKYRLDYLSLDSERMGDAYVRNGFGFESRLGTNLILDARFEASATPDFIPDGSDILAAQNTVFATLRMWL